MPLFRFQHFVFSLLSLFRPTRRPIHNFPLRIAATRNARWCKGGRRRIAKAKFSLKTTRSGLKLNFTTNASTGQCSKKFPTASGSPSVWHWVLRYQLRHGRIQPSRHRRHLHPDQYIRSLQETWIVGSRSRLRGFKPGRAAFSGTEQSELSPYRTKRSQVPGRGLQEGEALYRTGVLPQGP